MDKVRRPKPGELYQHFKGELYQIITLATHTETSEVMVVYQALYGDFKFYVRPYEIFVQEVDKEKYPQVQQKYRFELVKSQGEALNQDARVKSKLDDRINMVDRAPMEKEKVETKKVEVEQGSTVKELFQGEEGLAEINPVLSAFLDADSYRQKLEIIMKNRKALDDGLINHMSMAIDCTVEEGPIEERIFGLMACLEAMCKYEDRRLR